MKGDSDSVSQSPRRGDPQIPIDGANQLVAKVSRLYARLQQRTTRAASVDARHHPVPKGGNYKHGPRKEERKRMIEARERRILKFPLGMDARCVARLPGMGFN